MVTLLFTDIEGSTQAWDRFPDDMKVALARHDTVVRAVLEAGGGYVFKTVGDAFCCAFADPMSACKTAADIQRALAIEEWPAATPLRVRIALCTGLCEERDGDYFGPTVNRVARLEHAAHGDQILVSASTAELVREALEPALSLLDLGEHRLKDLGRPERIAQLCGDGLERDFPPLKTVDTKHANNIPEEVSTFVGRERELLELRELLGGARLVTLTGPGGVGKTRLAVRAATEWLEGDADGDAWFIELAPLTDPQLVAVTAGNVLGMKHAPLQTFVDALRDQTALLVFDNCEHVIDETARVADAILRSCPNIRVLTTSREPLGVRGENVFRVPPLSLPSVESSV
jgi:class 3 adenylate cyclase